MAAAAAAAEARGDARALQLLRPVELERGLRLLQRTLQGEGRPQPNRPAPVGVDGLPNSSVLRERMLHLDKAVDPRSLGFFTFGAFLAASRMVQLRVPIGKPTVVLYTPLPTEEQPTPEARAAELIARGELQDSGSLERWLHETWDLWHFTGVVNERTEVRGGTWVHLAVNAERLAALARLGREEVLEQHDLWLLSVAKAHELTLDAALATLQRGGGGLKSSKAHSRPGVQALWRGAQPFTAPTGSGRLHGHAFHPVRGGGVLGLSEVGRKEQP